MAVACFRTRPRAEPDRVLAGDRSRGQSRAFGVADVAAVPRHPGRGVAADRLALESRPPRRRDRGGSDLEEVKFDASVARPRLE